MTRFVPGRPGACRRSRAPFRREAAMSGAQHTTTIGQLPDELLSRILAAAATQPKGGCIDLRIA